MMVIGCGLMSHPKLMMLDEPSLGLAPMLVKQIFDIIKRINDEGVSVMLVEQNAHMALEVAGRGYVLETGEVKMTGRSERLANDDSVRAAYLGS